MPPPSTVTSSNGGNKWTSKRSGQEAGRGGRGRGGGGRAAAVASYSGRGRGRFSTPFVRGAATQWSDAGALSSVATGKGNKWVRKPAGTVDDVGESEVPSLETPDVDSGTKEVRGDNALEESSKPAATNEFVSESSKATDRAPIALERRGEHKLVLKKDQVEASHPTTSDTEAVFKHHSESTTVPENMERRGRGKLILKHDNKEAKKKYEPSNASTNNMHSYSWSRHPKEADRHSKDATKASDTMPRTGNTNQRKRKRSGMDHTHSAKTAGTRRICLNKPELNENSSFQAIGEHEGETDAILTNATTESASAQYQQSTSNKTLTDFCYRDTGRGKGSSTRGRGRDRSGREGGGGSMGLVRVKPDNLSDTPICRTFRLGMPCNNPKCTLRHDVSAEASRPICVFFQRNGMCSKGESCPFRHVKVRHDAEICPVFNSVGYCENPDCAMKHVVAKKARSSSDTIAQKKLSHR